MHPPRAQDCCLQDACPGKQVRLIVWSVPLGLRLLLRRQWVGIQSGSPNVAAADHAEATSV